MPTHWPVSNVALGLGGLEDAEDGEYGNVPHGGKDSILRGEAHRPGLSNAGHFDRFRSSCIDRAHSRLFGSYPIANYGFLMPVCCFVCTRTYVKSVARTPPNRTGLLKPRSAV